MQAVYALHLGHVEYAFGIQITFVRRVTANTDQCVLLAQLFCRHGLHVRIALHQYHIDILLLGNTD